MSRIRIATGLALTDKLTPGVAVPPAFSPSDITGLIGWWDLNDESSITRDGSSLIQQLNDKSGTGAHMTSPAAGNRPATVTVGSRQMGTFERTTPTCLMTTSAAYQLAANSAFELWVVYRTGDAGTTTRSIVAKGDELTARWGLFANSGGVNGQNNFRYRSDAGGIVNVLRNGGFSDDAVHWARTARAVAGSTTHEDDVGTTAGASNTGALTQTEPLWIAGFDNAIGDTNFYGFDGEVGEVLIYNATVAGTDRTDLISYLTTKWSI